MSEPVYRSFEEFWPFYVREHSKKGTRALHFTGTTIAIALAAYAAATRRPRALIVAPVIGYGMSWIGHFFVEKNRPATFTYPLWSLAADWKMWALMATGKLGAELTKHNIVPKSQAATPAS